MQEVLTIVLFLMITSSIVYQYLFIRKALTKKSVERRMLLRITLTVLIFSIILLVVILQEKLAGGLFNS